MEQPTLAEYDCNPFISKLPPIFSVSEMNLSLKVTPDFNEKERSYPTHIRKHCVLRLLRFFEPLERPIQLFEKVDILIRQGYIGRNPLTTDYIFHLHNGSERIAQKKMDAKGLIPIEITASCFSLLGQSGVGKSKSIERILHQYPKVIVHEKPFSLKQIVWLKLECPTGDSPKQFCTNFFASIDQLVGTNYLKWYGKETIATGSMVTHMSQVAALHAIGVLIIDEIQNLKSHKGTDDLMKFLLALVNKVSIPIIFIGNMSAVPLLQGTFRNARRASSLGSLIWERFPQGETWDYFVDRLWSYQWTKDIVPLTPEIREVLYDESQGIVDILIKLLVISQLRIMSIAEVRDISEELTVKLLQRVARDDFKLIRPMIKALRENNEKELKKIDDLTPFYLYFDEILSSELNRMPAFPLSTNKVEPQVSVDGSIQTLNALQAMGLADDIANVMLEEAQKKVQSDDPFLLMEEITKLMERQKPEKNKPPKKKMVRPSSLPEQDLRRIIVEGKESKLPAYDALLAACMVKPPVFDFAN